MTTVKLYKSENKILQIETIGHVDFDDHGKDIVCAALSSIIQTSALGLLSVVKINARIKKDEKQGYFSIKLPQEISDKDMEKAQIILETAIAGVTDLSVEYSKYIKLEVIDDVY